MPAEFDPRDQCIGKVAFATKAEAQRFLRRRKQFGTEKGQKPYKCPCGWFHNGHRPPAGTLAAAREKSAS